MRTVTPHNAHLIPPGAKRVFKGIIYDVYHWEQKLFDGRTTTFEMLKRKDSVKVLAVKGDKLLFLMEEQPGTPAEYSLPGGRHDVESETELQCAQRELKEELGMSFKNWKLIAVTQPSIEIERCIYLFVATNLEHEEPAHEHGDGGERIEIRELTYEQALAVEPTYSTLRFVHDELQKAGSLDGLLAVPEYS